MNLAKFNQKYEAILHSDLSGEEKDKQLSKLMTEMESEFNIPSIRNEEWEKKTRAVIALYRKVSRTRGL
ncbi:hypothetical protein [Mesobacillus zeae]|uniref:hypothetical protein n=1 Tax=Mesobacillus zeae TaxID=1917180 RepID=UPI0030096D61